MTQQRINKQQHRVDWTPLADVSPALIDSLLFTEDRDFYRHHGVDWGAFSRSALRYAIGQKTRGASTLTMQLAALLDKTLSWQSGGRTLTRKWRQMQAARQLERTWSKGQILEAYLNLVGWRGDLQGIGAASLALFGKWPRGLTQEESVILVGLLAAPNATSERVARRACTLAKAANRDIDCPALTVLAYNSLSSRQLPLVEQPDVLALASRLLTQPAQQVQTTLDKALQHYAYQSLRTQLVSLSQQQANAGAVLVLNNQTGEVLAYVANSGLDDTSIWVDGVQAPRQAGSTLKPFLYALALEHNLLTAASVVDDQPLNIPTELGLYVPQNYEKDFKGPVTVRTALASSLNVPAVLTLKKVGVENFWQHLKALGFTLNEQADYYGNALALGGADINLWQLANAYRVLANGGQRVGAPSVLADSSRHQSALSSPLLSPQASFIIADILSDRNARSLSFGYENPLATPFWTAVKTGTSKDMRDNWCVGFSRHFTVAVWVGNMQGLPMRDVSGISGAAPVWASVMNYLEAGQGDNSAPLAPAGLVRQQVDFSGFDQPAYAEWFMAGSEQTHVSYLADTVPQIIYPAHKMIIALDPDMPVVNQRVYFRAHLGGESLHFWLNGRDLGVAAHDYAWQPKRGRYHLALKTASGQTRADSYFEVRGKLSHRD